MRGLVRALWVISAQKAEPVATASVSQLLLFNCFFQVWRMPEMQIRPCWASEKHCQLIMMNDIMIYFGAFDSHTLLTSGVAGHLPKPQTGPPCMNSCCRAQGQHRRGIYFFLKKKGTKRWNEARWVTFLEKPQKAIRRVLQRSGNKDTAKNPLVHFHVVGQSRRVNRLMCRDSRRRKFIDSSFIIHRDKF